MKRFAMTVSLAACLVFLLGASAMAANSIVIESKSVAPSASGVFIGVYVSNDVEITGMTFPVELRSLSGGAFTAGPGASFSRGINPAGRMQTSPLGAGFTPPGNVTSRIFAVKDAAVVAACPTDASSGAGSWNTSIPSVATDPNFFVSPDAHLLATVSTGVPADGDDITMDPGQEVVGVDVPSVRFVTNVGASLGQFIIDSTCVMPANHVVFVDANTQPVQVTFVPGIITVEVPPNFCPTATIDNAVVAATVGSPASNDADATDADGPPPGGTVPMFYLASGPGAVDPNTGAWSYTPLCSDVPSFQVGIYATDRGEGSCTSAPSLVTFTVNVSPAPLTINCGADISVHWAGADAAKTINTSGGCPPYTYATSFGTISTNLDGSGAWSYNQGCADVGPHPVTVTVTDANQFSQTCSFTLTVTNTVPVCSQIAPTLFPEGSETCIDLGDGAQLDGDALTYTYVGGLPLTWNASIAGDQFCATRPAGDAGEYTVNYTVSDGCATLTCSFDIIFVNPCIRIVDARDSSFYSCWLNGQTATVCVFAEDGSIPGDAGGYDLLICYDQSGLSFLSASGGPAGWEYFTYRTGLFGGNCGGGCPDGYVHLISIADMNNGQPVPAPAFDINGEILACLTFYVTSDRNYINSCFHVGFCSFACGDNTISSKDGNVVWAGADGVNNNPVTPCDGLVKGVPVDSVLHFCPGAICVCEPPDDRGDLNLNGIANEIGDAVLYTNYFIYGPGVWDPVWEDVQILASDINDDGIVLTVADLIYLIRILTGDAQPFPPGTGNGSPKLAPYANSVNVVSDVTNGAVTVRTNASVEIGAAMLVFRYSGTIGTPVLANNSGMEIRSNAANGELRVLVSGSVESAAARLGTGANNLVTIPVDGTIELVESQFSDYNGALLQVNAASASVPTEYALNQNYPNPFNAGTVIPVSLSERSDYTLTIFNVAGQVVRTFAGNGIGTINVAWDGRTTDGVSVASGMYFYRLSTPKFSATKKMVVLK